MMNCNNTIQCHDSRQKDNTMVHISTLGNEILETGVESKKFKNYPRV